MPIAKYDKNFGGKPGSAQKAHDAMAKEYGAKEGESVFYAKKNKNKAAGHVTGPNPHLPSSRRRGQ